jgi:hypothetical protein
MKTPAATREPVSALKRSAWGMFILLLACVGGVWDGCDSRPQKARKLPNESQVRTFFAAKEKQAKRLAEEDAVFWKERNPKHPPVSPEVWRYFDAARQGDWTTVERLYRGMARRCYHFAAKEEDVDQRLSSLAWQPVNETFRFYEQCALTNPKHALAFGREILDSMPRGSVYVGNSDAGRFVVTALCRDQTAGDPVFVITLNGFTDDLYLRYLALMHEPRLRVLSGEDMQQAFEIYRKDAELRLNEHRLLPSERVWRDSNGVVQVAGYTAVLEVAGYALKACLEKNPDRQFFMEAVGVPEWLYPHLLPHGPILRVSREAFPELGAEVLKRDKEYWSGRFAPLIGNWLTEETPLSQLCDFVEKVHVRRDLTGFSGDREFIETSYGWHGGAEHIGAVGFVGNARASIGEVFHWRGFRAKTPEGSPASGRGLRVSASLRRRSASLHCGQKAHRDARLATPLR